MHRLAKGADMRKLSRFALGAVIMLGLSSQPVLVAQENSSAQEFTYPREIWSFPSYPRGMTESQCLSLYQQLGSAASRPPPNSTPSEPIQSISDEAIEWALKYEEARKNGEPCPTVPAAPAGPRAEEITYPREIWSFSSYPRGVTESQCLSLYQQIGAAMSRPPPQPAGAEPVQAVSDEAIEWALRYEKARQNGDPCPPVPSAPAD